MPRDLLPARRVHQDVRRAEDGPRRGDPLPVRLGGLLPRGRGRGARLVPSHALDAVRAAEPVQAHLPQVSGFVGNKNAVVYENIVDDG